MEQYANNPDEFDHTNIYVIVRAIQRLNPPAEEVEENETFGRLFDWIESNVGQLSMWSLIYCLEVFPSYRESSFLVRQIDELLLSGVRP